MVSDITMAPATGTRAGFLRRAVIFTAIGLALYGGLHVLAERQVRATGERNPLYQITTLPGQSDVIILGASHAMPLGFEGIETALEEASSRDVTVLAIEGGGILPNAFLTDVLLRRSTPAQVVYSVDSFAFLSAQWNEERLTDSALYARAPLNGAVVGGMINEAATWPALPAYLTGFDKINALLWPEPDRSEAELTKFERTYRETPRIDEQRIAYLFPPADEAMLESYLSRFEDLVTEVQATGAEFSILLMPAPPRYTERLPESHDRVMAGLGEIAARHGVTVIDHTGLLQEDENYYDTDHLNRTGASAYVTGPLAEVLRRE